MHVGYCPVFGHALTYLSPEDLMFTVSHQACAGLLADARAVVDVGRAEAANYRAEYGRPIPCKVN